MTTLYYSNSSPYSRKVRLVLQELNLSDQVENRLINPFETDNDLKSINPLGKIPVLIVNNKTLYDSPVICQYLIETAPSNHLLAKDKYWDILQWQALADGVMDASYQTVIEFRRPEAEQSKTWLAHWSDDINRSLNVMQDELNLLGDETTLAHLSFATAISYIEFRLPYLLENNNEIDVLLAWYQIFRKNASMQATELS